MKKILTFNFIALLLTGMLGISAAAQNSSPTLLKRTVHVSIKKYLRWWKNPAAAEPVYNTYSWVPQIRFDVLGVLPANSQLTAEFDTTDGKPWLSYKMETPELEDDVQKTILIQDEISDSELEKKAIVTEGVYPFRIRLKSGGADRILFSGKYKVATYTPDQKIPEYKGKKEFYVDFDWQIPFGYLWLNPQVDEKVPQLATLMCFRGTNESNKMEAFLFYNGKQISKKEAFGGNYIKQTMSSPIDDPLYRWQMWQFVFDDVRGFNKSQSANDYSSQFFLDKNPGEYEIKVMREGQLARAMKFTVGADGKIVDNGVKDKNRIGGVRMIFPVGVIGTADGKWNAAAWKTDALYANPLVGFTAIQ